MRGYITTIGFLLISSVVFSQSFEYTTYTTKIVSAKDTSINSFDTDIQMSFVGDSLVVVENSKTTAFKITAVLLADEDAIFLQFNKAYCILRKEKAILHMVYNDQEGNPYIHVTNIYSK